MAPEVPDARHSGYGFEEQPYCSTPHMSSSSGGRLEAKARGIRFGRKPTVDQKRVWAPHYEELGATEIARQMNIGRSTVYKIPRD